MDAIDRPQAIEFQGQPVVYVIPKADPVDRILGAARSKIDMIRDIGAIFIGEELARPWLNVRDGLELFDASTGGFQSQGVNVAWYTAYSELPYRFSVWFPGDTAGRSMSDVDQDPHGSWFSLHVHAGSAFKIRSHADDGMVWVLTNTKDLETADRLAAMDVETWLEVDANQHALTLKMAIEFIQGVLGRELMSRVAEEIRI